MKHSAPLYSRLALITSVTLITGYLIVSAVWTDMGSVGTGDQLSATLWNTLVANVNDLDTRLKSTASTWPTVTGGIAYTGGNVGIGTVSPGYPLDITGLVNTQGTLGGFRAAPRDGIGTSFSWYNPTGDDFRMYASAIGDLLTVQMNGNVGIGTTDPGGYRTAIRGSTDDNTASALWVSGASSLTGALIVRNDGNVGIGTASPVMKLEVNGSIKAAGLWDLDSTYFVNPDASGTAGAFNGNVGIGTTVPHAKIHTLGQTFMMGSTPDLVWGSVGTVFQGEFGAASGNTYTKLESFTAGGSVYGNLAINPGGGNVGIGAIPTGTKLKVTQATDNQWASLIENTGPIAGQNFGLTVRAGTNSSDISFSVMDKALGNYYLYVRGDGNVGIGTASPGANLQVNSPTGGTIRLQYTGNSGFARLTTDAANSLILGTVNSLSSVFIQDITGNVGIGTVSPGNFKLKVDGGPLGVYHSQNTNSVLQVVGKDAPSSATFLAVMASGNGADNEFIFQSDGTAKADGTWNGGGADYAEWFEKEGDILGGALIGLNAETGKVRTWQKGDIFMGIQSLNPGFIGNNIHGAETKEADMVKTHVLVALVGQVEVKSGDIIETGRRIMTTDGQFIGLRLSNGNVFIK